MELIAVMCGARHISKVRCHRCKTSLHAFKKAAHSKVDSRAPKFLQKSALSPGLEAESLM